MTNKTELFPKIGDIADQADKIDLNEETTIEKENGQVDNEEKVVQEIESLFIVMSFKCEHCGASNNEIQSAGTIRPEGSLYTAKILDRADLNRQIVRSASCGIVIPEVDLTLPSTSRGQLTTVEGLIRDVVADLSLDQPLRHIQNEEGYKKVQKVIDKLKAILGDDEDEDDADSPHEKNVSKAADKDVSMPAFTVRLDDPAGNSFIEFVGSMADPKWNMRTYPRTLEQNVALGLVARDDEEAARVKAAKQVITGEIDENVPITDDEIFVFPGVCSSCGHPIETHMKKVNIPYFKDIWIMSTNCEHCGYRDNEVKSGSAISEKGKKITLKCEDREDLSRDILKSETAGMTIPEIELVLTNGTLGGRFTTVEGILDQIYEELAEKAFVSGDSTETEERVKFEKFLSGLKAVKNAEHPFTIILDDPLANSYIQNLYAPDPDPNMTIELYERTFEQNEELGLNDIKVEGYEQDAPDTTEVPKGEEAKVEEAKDQ